MVRWASCAVAYISVFFFLSSHVQILLWVSNVHGRYAWSDGNKCRTPRTQLITILAVCQIVAHLSCKCMRDFEYCTTLCIAQDLDTRYYIEPSAVESWYLVVVWLYTDLVGWACRRSAQFLQIIFWVLTWPQVFWLMKNCLVSQKTRAYCTSKTSASWRLSQVDPCIWTSL